MSWWSDFWDDIGDAIRPPQGNSDENTDEAMRNLENLLPQFQEQYNQYTGNVNNLFANNPQLNLKKFIDALGGYSSQLSDIRKQTEAGVGKYLKQGEEYTTSMLDEIMSSTGDYLSGYKKLARSEMPGMDIYRDQIGSNLAGNVQLLKSMGGGSQNAIAQLLQGNQNQLAGLALEAGKYKTQSQKDLANAYLTSGTMRGNALNQAAGFQQNAAGIRTDLGQFSSGVVGQQAGITGQQAGMENTMFQNNEMIPWLQELMWNESQAQQFNPLDFASQLYGAQIGFYESESDEERQLRMANQQRFFDMFSQLFGNTEDLGELLPLLAGGA